MIERTYFLRLVGEEHEVENVAASLGAELMKQAHRLSDAEIHKKEKLRLLRVVLDHQQRGEQKWIVLRGVFEKGIPPPPASGDRSHLMRSDLLVIFEEAQDLLIFPTED